MPRELQSSKSCLCACIRVFCLKGGYAIVTRRERITANSKWDARDRLFAVVLVGWLNIDEKDTVLLFPSSLSGYKPAGLKDTDVKVGTNKRKTGMVIERANEFVWIFPAIKVYVCHYKFSIRALGIWSDGSS